MELMGFSTETTEGERSSTLATVMHWSGTMILSGNASTLSGLLASAGTAAGAPAVLAGAAASVVVIGSGVWLCSDAD